MNELTIQEPKQDLIKMGEIFAASGMFPEHRDAAQCATKLLVGQGMGLNPYDSMSLHIIQGKVVLGSNVMAAAIKRSGRYDYRATTTEDSCAITFYDLTQRDEDGRPTEIGTTSFSMDDAKRAGLNGQNWKKYPKAMLFARAISAGYREHCPDALGMAPVYIEEHGETEIPAPAKPKDVFAEVSLMLQNREDGDEIRQKAIARAGVEYLADLSQDQLERMHEWLRTN